MLLSEVVKRELTSHRYVMGLSGGVDSMVLLDLLENESLLDRVELVYINHGIRPESSAEAKVLQDYVNKKGRTLHVRTLSLGELTGSFETVAREGRYKVFKELADIYNCVGVLTGHHGDDLVETILMRIVRGSGSTGLVGISELNEDMGNGLRKLSGLYHYTKKEIEAYANRHGIIYMEDSTNSDLTIPRNYVRHTLLPHLSKLNPRYAESFVRLSEAQKLDKDYWEYKYVKMKEDYIVEYGGVGYELTKQTVLNLHELEQVNLMYGLLKELMLGKEVTSVHVGILQEELHATRDSKGLNLGNGLVVFSHKGRLMLVPTTSQPKSSLPLHAKQVKNKKEERVKGKRITKYLSEIGLPLYYRGQDMYLEGETLYLSTGQDIHTLL